MRSGWLVTVARKSDGTDSVVDAYVVAEPDPGKAVELLRSAVALRPDQTVVGVFALQQSVVSALGVQAGAVAQFR